MANRQFRVTKEEENKLKAAYDNCKDGRISKKLLGLRLYGTGHPVETIMDLLGCSRASLQGWSRQYREEGLVGLADKRVGGNRCKLSVSQKAEVADRLHQYTPHQILGETTATASGEHWTTKDLQTVIYRWYSVLYNSPTSYWLLLAECGLSYQRTEKVFKSRSDFKVADFEEQLEKK